MLRTYIQSRTPAQSGSEYALQISRQFSIVDTASGMRQARGRSQRSKTRVDYTTQIYIGAPPKKSAQSGAESNSRQRVSQECNTQANSGNVSTKPSVKVASLRGSRGKSGKHTTVSGTPLHMKSNLQAADDILADIQAKPAPSHLQTVSVVKRTRDGGACREQEPAANVKMSPARKRRKGKGGIPQTPEKESVTQMCLFSSIFTSFCAAAVSGEHAASVGHKENVELTNPDQKDQQVHEIDAEGLAVVPVDVADTPSLDQPHPLADERACEPRAVLHSTNTSQPGTSRDRVDAEATHDRPVSAVNEDGALNARDAAQTNIHPKIVDNAEDRRCGETAWDHVDAIFLNQTRQMSTKFQFSQVNVRPFIPSVGLSWQKCHLQADLHPLHLCKVGVG